MAATVAATANVLKIAAVLGAVEDLRPKRLPEHALTVSLQLRRELPFVQRNIRYQVINCTSVGSMHTDSLTCPFTINLGHVDLLLFTSCRFPHPVPLQRGQALRM